MSTKAAVVNGFSAFNKSGKADFLDNASHGTHVEGTIAGTGVGVSKLASYCCSSQGRRSG